MPAMSCFCDISEGFLIGLFQAQANFWKGEANKMIQRMETEKASQCYNLALEYAPEQAIELKRECFDVLADIYFEGYKFTECIEYGEKGYAQPMKNEVRDLFVEVNFVTEL